MKYESNILKRLIDTYGVVGNPRYISEIIKEFIVRGKECFPNLFTYQADWLAHIDEFGLNPTYTVSYTGQSIYAPNTLERPVKSAILLGSTLVNLFKETNRETEVNESYLFFKINGIQLQTLKANTQYTLIYDKYVDGISTKIHKTHTDELTIEGYQSGQKFTFTTLSDVGNEIHIFIKGNTLEITQEMLDLQPKIMIIEGDHTQENIPYFDGMQSVKMPVLTTSNEDGTKTNILSVNEDVTLRGIGDVKDTLDCLTGEVTERIGEIVLNGNSDENWVSKRNIVINGIDYLQYYLVSNPISNKNYSSATSLPNIISDKGITDPFNGLWTGGSVKTISVREDGGLYYFCMNFPKNEDIKEWLSQNPITICYQLATESVKTVALTTLDQNGRNVEQLMTFNGGTHFNTGSAEGSPLPTVSVSVETDLEETLMMCSLEGYTM